MHWADKHNAALKGRQLARQERSRLEYELKGMASLFFPAISGVDDQVATVMDLGYLRMRAKLDNVALAVFRHQETLKVERCEIEDMRRLLDDREYEFLGYEAKDEITWT